MWSRIKARAAVATVGTLRLGSSVGSTLFGVLNSFKYAGKENHPLSFPAACASMTLDALTTLITAFPALYRQFRPKTPEADRDAERGTIAIEDKSNEELRPSCCECHCCGFCVCTNDLKIKGRLVYYILIINGLISAGFVAQAYHLGAVVLAEFIRARIHNKDEPMQEWDAHEIAAAQLFAIACGTANYIYFYSYRLQMIKANARKFGKHLDDGTRIMDADVVKALAVSAFPLISGPFAGYFSATSSFQKIPFIKIPATFASSLAGTSAFTAVLSTLASEVPTVYDMFHSQKQQVTYLENPKAEPVIRYAVYFIGGLDVVNTIGVSTFISMVNTSHLVFGTDPYGWMVVPATICAVGKSIMGFTFAIRSGYNATWNDYHTTRGHIAYSPVEPSIEKVTTKIEVANANVKIAITAEITNEKNTPISIMVKIGESKEIYSTKNSPVLFQKAPSPEIKKQENAAGLSLSFESK